MAHAITRGSSPAYAGHEFEARRCRRKVRPESVRVRDTAQIVLVAITRWAFGVVPWTVRDISVDSFRREVNWGRTKCRR